MWDGDLTGEVVDGRYALGNLYGSGGMAEVYRAFDTRLDRKVAIKVFQGTATHEDQIRLDREAQVLAGLRCPGVVTVYDTGSYRGRPFYVMQPVEGGTLRRRMREPLPPEVVGRIGAQVAEILAHVHRHDVVHRDVKPSNILLEPGERRAYLADFGLALQAQVTRVTRSGMLVGTAGYLAPEQVRGAEVGPASDVYALGLVLLECLTGRPEYPGGDTEAALARLHRDPRVPEDLPQPWRDVLTAMTHALPSKRPTAAECARLLMAAELASVGAAPLTEVQAAPRPEPVVPPPPVELPRPTPKRRAAAAFGGVAVVVVAVAHAAVFGLREPVPADTREQPATTTHTVVVTQSPSTVTVVEQDQAETVVVVAPDAAEPTRPAHVEPVDEVEPTSDVPPPSDVQPPGADHTEARGKPQRPSTGPPTTPGKGKNGSGPDEKG
ncbi:protein kinase [Actinosynnema sp. NPDC050436]|uniref:serine/threonine-protein kinase n=1 Tax=Actinosynnema sp. NPDC050436 TaxID=3155659 RepID=UPI0033DBAA0C